MAGLRLLWKDYVAEELEVVWLESGDRAKGSQNCYNYSISTSSRCSSGCETLHLPTLIPLCLE